MRHKRTVRHVVGNLLSEGHTVRHVVVHLLTPLLMCFGMGLSYLGAFHAPEAQAHGLKVAVVGTSARSHLLAQAVKDTAGDALDVTTVPDRATARRQIMDRDLVGAYVPSARHAELLVAEANSSTSADAAAKVFTAVAARQGAPLKVTDLSRSASGDPTHASLFFLLVALSVGSYAGVAAIVAAGAALSVWKRAAIGIATALAVSVIGAVLAGPCFHVVDHDLWGVWGMALMYSAGILTIGIGLHTFLKRLTTLALMVLFVMLNFTTSGGVFEPELQNGFFGALHAFWNGAGFVEGARSLLYFDSAGLGSRVLSLVLWLVAGLLLVAAAAIAERRATSASASLSPAEADALEEMGEAVAV
ncbi:hypothetical protein [Streptomyces glomeratus]|uniref:DUF3533 domain-containing protein n=1 Tax=Streptomyces glomeratus TaxID=284452 RepID=A0ABP6KZ20_9ACTN|nr:hypothetical protein [Streptomyces glomeratus]MCF1512040.1 hypothetical protein [Streptomyces glomeratus]